jgi:hypothetical protein
MSPLQICAKKKICSSIYKMPKYKHSKRTISLPSKEFQWMADKDGICDPMLMIFEQQALISMLQ